MIEIIQISGQDNVYGMVIIIKSLTSQMFQVNTTQNVFEKNK